MSKNLGGEARYNSMKTFEWSAYGDHGAPFAPLREEGSAERPHPDVGPHRGRG
jgi:hypothetical protein